MLCDQIFVHVGVVSHLCCDKFCSHSKNKNKNHVLCILHRTFFLHYLITHRFGWSLNGKFWLHSYYNQDRWEKRRWRVQQVGETPKEQKRWRSGEQEGTQFKRSHYGTIKAETKSKGWQNLGLSPYSLLNKYVLRISISFSWRFTYSA